jgi:hypothetical protein
MPLTRFLQDISLGPDENGTVEAFDVVGFDRIGEFASVAEAAAFAYADVEMPRLTFAQ